MAGQGAEESLAKWDGIYRQLPDVPPEPACILVENAHLLPAGGVALDLACGLGGNALFLAQRGFKSLAWDISQVAIDRLRVLAGRLGLAVEAEVRDVERSEFPREFFDVVVVSRFLARNLAGVIANSLKRGGLLYYQTYVRDKVSPSGPSNPAYLLAENELLSLFRELRPVVYREEGRRGDLSLGRRDEAFFIGQKI
jgi:SAM-dependent methyltransferase